jgi:hypothetical protein
MADILSMDDLVYAVRGANPIPLRKTGGAMEGAGNYLHSKWYEAGVPGAGAAPSAGLNGAALTSDPTQVSGQVPFVKAASGNTKRLAGLSVAVDRAGALFLLDRMWANSSIVITTTTAQTITPAAAPSRDANGAALGEGVMAAIEVSAATGNGGAITNTTISYTNESGTAGRTGTIDSFPASAVAGTFVPFNLQAGDRGVRSIQSVTLGTTYVSGTIHLIQYRVLAVLPCPAAGAHEKFWDQLGNVKLHDGCVPFLAWAPLDTTAVNISSGLVIYAEK